MDKLHEIALQALEALKEAGAEDACVTAYEVETREFNVDAGEFSLFRTLFDRGLRLTAFREQKKGTASLNRFDAESIRAAAKDCLETAASAAADPCWQLAPEGKQGAWSEGACTPDLDRFFQRSQELMDDVRRDFPQVLVTQFVLDHRSGREIYVNSRGADFSATSGAYSVSLDFSGHDGEVGSSFFYTGFSTVDLDTPFIDQCTVRQELQNAVDSIHTQPVAGKFTGSVILTPLCVQDFVGTALALFTGDQALMSGTSLWKDKLGEAVASPLLTIQAAPLDPRILNGERWTGEGYVSENYTVLDRGVLQAFMLGQYAANRTGLKRAPNTDGSLVIQAGDKTLAELIAGVEDGLLVGRFSGGQPSANGDFSGVAKNSFRIQNGRLTGAVSETMIAGNLAALLQSITGISKETVQDGGTVLPWIAAEGVVISGQ